MFPDSSHIQSELLHGVRTVDSSSKGRSDSLVLVLLSSARPPAADTPSVAEPTGGESRPVRPPDSFATASYPGTGTPRGSDYDNETTGPIPFTCTYWVSLGAPSLTLHSRVTRLRPGSLTGGAQGGTVLVRLETGARWRGVGETGHSVLV